MRSLALDTTQISVWIGVIVEAVALLLIPAVVLRRKDPSSTAAWILALVFLPGLGATLFLLFGRDRVRLPVQRKHASDRALPHRVHYRHTSGAALRERALTRLGSPVDREVFRVAAALAGAEPTPGNEAELLVDGNAAYEAIGRAIDGASKSVYAEYYLVRRGRTADWFRDRLAAAARRGVEVKLLLDGYGSFWIGRRWVRSPRRGGRGGGLLPPGAPDPLPAHEPAQPPQDCGGRPRDRVHRRDQRGRRVPRRGGPLARHAPPDRRARRARARPRLRAGLALRDAARSPRARSPLGPEIGGDRGEATVAVVRSGPDIPGTERETIDRVFFSAITLARSRVFITTPDFIPDRAIVVALQTAALRGVDVRLLFPSRSNHPIVFQAGRSFYEELLEAGVSIYEYGPGMIHAKTMVVDGTLALVGSANMDLRSFRLNFEVHAVLRDERTAARLDACFADDLARSRRVDPEAFRQRGIPLRVLEGAARFLSPLM